MLATEDLLDPFEKRDRDRAAHAAAVEREHALRARDRTVVVARAGVAVGRARCSVVSPIDRGPIAPVSSDPPRTFPRRRLRHREIVAEPVAQQVPHAGVALAEHEMVGVAEQVQLGRLAGALEQLDRLLGRRHRIVRRMQQQQRARRDLADHVVGAEVEHALRGLGRERLDRVGASCCAGAAGSARCRSAAPSATCRCLARCSRPSASMSVKRAQASGARVLAAELALAVAPAAVGDHRGDARVDAAGVDRDRGAEARADDADALGIDRGMLGEEGRARCACPRPARGR